MNDNNILLLKGDEIVNLFKGRDQEILQAVKLAYQTHAKGDSSLPHSNFLRFPNNEKDRIIALPAYLGGDVNTAGIKWIASFPGNLALGMERASAVLILNSAQTGHPQAIMESSVISAKRTAASAAIAAKYLRSEQSLATVGLIGTGLINFETVRFLLATRPEIETLLIYDLSRERAEQFKHKCQQLSEQLEIAIVEEPNAIFQNASVICFATTASKPHIFDISECRPDSIILHTSLRDLSPEIILSADNIVDDVDHVCRAQTSIHLAEQLTGNRNFIRCTLGDVLNGIVAPRQDNNKIAIFSPFGLGVLDLALGQLAYKLAIAQNQGTTIKSFLPVSWLEREEH
ncbi:MAG: 2,3-diaminopropionate biosynthesis protein SbnB [Iphinoe sp. HA4291-MV1]|jgi:ornithine cyclodeaminase|nr:2,3-diaminopropionate biosynthesis protein SbnB [Iphinoe sp. HA4291-MV1]